MLQDGNYAIAGTHGLPANGQGEFQAVVPNGVPLYVTVSVGDAQQSIGNVQIYLQGNLVQTINTAAADQFEFFTTTVTVSSGPLDLVIVDTNSTYYWVINSLAIRTAENPLTITRADGNTNPVTADGQTVDTYNGSGAAPGELITLSTNQGTIVTPTADSVVKGLQVQANSQGDFTFQMLRPTGDAPATVTAQGTLGMSFGTFTQQYQLPTSRSINFVTTTSPAAPGYVNLPPSLYVSPAVNALGWVTGPAQAFDRGTSDPLLRDGAFDSVARAFDIDLASAGNYYVTVVMGDPSYAWTNMSVSLVSGYGSLVAGSLPTNVSTPVGQSSSFTFEVASNASGQIRLQFQAGSSYWVVNYIDVRPAQAPSP